MFRITSAKFLAPQIKRLEIHAPRVARMRQAGQFVIVRVHDQGERIPLTIADSNPESGEITLIVQGVGKTTQLINALEAGDSLLDVVGPLGAASEIGNFGCSVVIGGGVGTAIAYPTAVALKQAGNRVIGVLGARNRELLILEEELRATTDQLFLMTDDGSYGEQGFVTTKLQELIDQGTKIDHVLAIGPVPMMKAVAEVTRPYQIQTIVSLNPIMVDGTGMCGGCRVLVGGTSKFACVDGPEFDAHQVDFEVLMQRNRMYRTHEQAALAEQDKKHADSACHLEMAHPQVGPQFEP